MKGRTLHFFVKVLYIFFVKFTVDVKQSFSLCQIARNLPLGDVRTLNATQVIFVNLFACCFLSEPCGAAEIQTVLVTLLGIVMVTNPPFLFGHQSVAEGDEDVDSVIRYDSSYYLTVCVVLGGTVFQAVSFVCCRYLRDVHPNVLSAWGGTVGILPSLLCAYLSSGGLELPALRLAPHILAVGILSYVSQVGSFEYPGEQLFPSQPTSLA